MRHALPHDALEIGQPLPWDVFDAAGQLLLCRGYVLTRDSQIAILSARGVYIDERLLRGAGRRTMAPPENDPFSIWTNIRIELEALLRNIRLEEDFARQIGGLAGFVNELADRNPDTALAAMILTDQRNYATAHSLHVAILCELAGRRLQWEETRRRSLVCAAMTMNLAMLDLQDALVSQRAAPTPQQRELIRRHPQLAKEMLREAEVVDPIWLRAVEEHHEAPGGHGYPTGIVSPCEEAQLLRTADIFSAKVSPRAARKPVSVREAARSLLMQGEGSQPDPLAAVLIKEVGIFPPGTCVQLANGETGVVWKRGAQANTPVVASVLSAAGSFYDRPVRRQTSDKQYEVVSVLPRDKLRVNVNFQRIWQMR